MLRSLFGIFARSRLAARLLFGLDLPSLPRPCHYFDVTTIALARASRPLMRPGLRVLDMGAGSAGVLGLVASKRGCEVTATELHEPIARQAEESIAHVGAAIEVRRGAFFADVTKELDLVLFNPPYVPTEAGLERGLPEELRTQWDGGPRGTDVLCGLLDAVAARGDSPLVLMGVNGRHVSRELVEPLIQAHPGVELERVDTSALGVDVYFFSTKKSPIASASNPQA